MDRRYLYVALASAVLLFGGVFLIDSDSESADTPRSVMEGEGFDTQGLTALEMESDESEEIAGIDKREIVAVNGSTRLEVEIYNDVEAAFASNFIQDRKKELGSMYTDRPAPYGGIPEKNVDCDEEYTAEVVREDGNTTVYSLYANEDLALGACSDQEAEYRVSLGLGYCPGLGKIYESRLHVPEGSPESDISIGCPN